MLKTILISNQIKEEIPDDITGRFHVLRCTFREDSLSRRRKELQENAVAHVGKTKNIISLRELPFYDSMETLCIAADQEELSAIQRENLPGIGYEGEEAVDPFYGTGIVLQNLSEIDADYLIREHARMTGQEVIIAETEHLVLREMKVSDLPKFYELYEDEQIRQFIEPLHKDMAEEEERCRNYIKLVYPIYNFGMWTIVYKETGEVIGRVGFGFPEYEGVPAVDFGYLISPKYRRQGLSFEAAQAAITFAREESGMKKVLLYTDPANVASIRLAEKLGFGFIRMADVNNGKKYRVYEKCL